MRKLTTTCFYWQPLCCLLVFQIAAFAQTDSDKLEFDVFSRWFVAEYNRLDIQPLVLGYIDNLNQVASAKSIEDQQTFFTQAKQRLSRLSQNQLPASNQVDYQVADFEIRLNLQRLKLSEELFDQRPEDDHTKGIYHVANGKQWYAYFLNRWLGTETEPDVIFDFGMQQIKRAKDNIGKIRQKTGQTPQEFSRTLRREAFFTDNQSTVQSRFEAIRRIVSDNLSGQFFVYPDVPRIKIAQGDNEALSQVPGYYNGQSGTFFYNLFDKPYNKRESDWLYLHEAIPGHHFQNFIEQSQDHSELRRLNRYYGFSEGWAAYVEELGNALGLYQDDYAYLGKWEWDIVRSVRVPLDVGINYYGWDDKKALAFWRQHIKNRDDIGEREIQRMRRWPAQVITYKYGADQILQWKQQLIIENPATFSVQRFHDYLLVNGPLPLDVLRQLVLEGDNNICSVPNKDNRS